MPLASSAPSLQLAVDTAMLRSCVFGAPSIPSTPLAAGKALEGVVDEGSLVLPERAFASPCSMQARLSDRSTAGTRWLAPLVRKCAASAAQAHPPKDWLIAETFT